MKSLALRTSTLVLSAMLSACGGGGSDAPVAAPGQPDASSHPVAAATLSTTAADFPYSITLLGTLEGDSYAVAVNDFGEVTGNYLDQNGHPNAFLWQQGTMTSVMRAGQASAINNAGQVVGWGDATGTPEAFLYDIDGHAYLLNSTGGSSKALAINDAGQTAGRLTQGSEHAFVEDNGNLQIVSGSRNGYAVAMNNRGQVLVKEVTGNGFRTLLWDQGTLTDLGTLGGLYTQGQDLNDAGQVVGWAQAASGQYHAFLWENGVMTDLAPVLGPSSAAIAINERGEILAKSSTAAGEHTIILRNGAVTDLENFGSSYAVATDLNNNGQIVGWLAADSGVIQAFLATPR